MESGTTKMGAKMAGLTFFRSMEINYHSQFGLQVCFNTQKVLWFMFSAATGNINFMLLRLGAKCLFTKTLSVMID